jgi:hypothetical protein
MDMLDGTADTLADAPGFMLGIAGALPDAPAGTLGSLTEGMRSADTLDRGDS